MSAELKKDKGMKSGKNRNEKPTQKDEKMSQYLEKIMKEIIVDGNQPTNSMN